MKILLCTNAFENVTNGPAKFANLMLLMNNYHPEFEVRVLTEDCAKSLEGKVYKQYLAIPKFLKPLGMFLRMLQYHKTAMRIRKTSFKFDLLVYNNAIVGIWSALIFKNTIGFINDDTYATTSWDNFWGLNWNKNRLFFKVEQFAAKKMKRTIVNSNYLKNTLIEKYSTSEKKVTRLYKAIEIKTELALRNNTVPTILFVKNDFERGGLSILIKALQIRALPCILVVAGPAKSAEPHLNELLKNDTNITFIFKGSVTQQEVYNLMREADIFCVPSFKEALGVANIEAMALGCSIISTNVGGIPEVLDNGKNGWLVDPGDANALSKALSSAIEDIHQRNQKIQNGHIFVSQFSLENLFANFKKVITDLA